MNTKFSIDDNGIIFVPKFIKQESDLEFGSVVTHEDYNEKVNLHTRQGDYNTEILRLLFTDSNPTRVPHIKYLDKIITDQVNRIDGTLNNFDERLTANDNLVRETREEMRGFTKNVSDIISGVTQVGHAVQADKLTGVESVGNYKYYGTGIDGSPGFHEMPAALYAKEIESNDIEVNGIYFTPRENSVDETMLSASVRDKLNRESISSYNELTNRPYLNNVLLEGNITLAQIGAQPAGNYLTEIPDTYATKEYVNTAVVPFITTENVQTNYTPLTAHNTLTDTVASNKDYAEGRYARVCINSFSGTPKTGDILISL
jgi:hypothetical protein